ncbi:TPA: hypothetical protein N0F65_002627 [Lagenidium giganteum]|uniref:FYVE-type domain-containing protein n=1 Tax=Lagenidium giganteum TaxID=4803 RepID=A0AAV2Z6E7_9STRA|nr:TPA: hypothetical protein N0F65_002627 [Lagenidium giganteum]
MLQPLPRSSGSSTTSSRGTQSLTGVRGEKASTASHLLRSGLKPFRGIRVSMRKKKSSKQSRRSLSRAGSGRSSHLKSSSGGIRLSQDDMHELRAMAAAASTASASSSPYTMGTATDMGSGTTAKLQSWRSGWKALGRTSKRKNTTPPLYSISFYPWKMEAHGYYSHPEAAAEWVPDTASSRCQICLTSFSLTRRRHHCRLCGRLVCGECSLQRTYLPLAKDRRQHHQMIKDGAPQRTCNSCANTLKNMVAQHDHRVKCFAVDHGVPVDTATSMPTRSASMSTLRDSTLSEDPYETALSLPGDDSTRSVVTSDDIPTRAEELEVILRARAFSRDRSVSAQYVISSQWLEQWLQYVHMDPSAPPAMAFTGSGMSSQSSTSSSRWHTTRRKARNRRPGPIANYALVDFVNGKLVPKSELERSRGNDVGGDYRVVSEDVWFAFHELYGGGPSIRLQQPSPGRRSFSGGSLSSRALISTSSFYSTASTRSLDMVEFVDTARWVISECDEHIRVATSAARIAIGDGVGSSGEYARQTTSRKTEGSFACNGIIVVHEILDTNATDRALEAPPPKLRRPHIIVEHGHSRDRGHSLVRSKRSRNGVGGQRQQQHDDEHGGGGL